MWTIETLWTQKCHVKRMLHMYHYTTSILSFLLKKKETKNFSVYTCQNLQNANNTEDEKEGKKNMKPVGGQKLFLSRFVSLYYSYIYMRLCACVSEYVYVSSRRNVHVWVPWDSRASLWGAGKKKLLLFFLIIA